jgi:hypothetical protein
MRAKKIIIAFLILMSCLFSFLSNVIAADNVTIDITMFQGEKQTRFNKPIIVAGVWHYVNITIDQNIDEFTIKLYKGVTLPTGNKNETNYYEWKYDKNNATVWNDISRYGVDYIKRDYCTKSGDIYSFCVGVKDTLPNIADYCENWTMDVYNDGNKLHSEGIVVETPTTGPSLSKPSSIIFYVDPFTEMDAQGDAFFKIGNVGNIPLYVNIDNTKYSNIEITDLKGKILPEKFLPGEPSDPLYVILHSESWPPGIKEMDVQLNASCPISYFIDTDATITLQNSFVIDVPQLKIYVGHSNYKIEEIQGTGITFQHIEKLDMSEGEIKDIKAYVSGDGTVSLDVSADEENVKLLKLLDGSTEKNSPISFASTSNSERTITVKVEAISEGKTGTISYKLTTGGITQTYTTQITIGPPASHEKGTSISSVSIVQIVVIILVLLVVVYMVLSYFKHRRR